MFYLGEIIEFIKFIFFEDATIWFILSIIALIKIRDFWEKHDDDELVRTNFMIIIWATEFIALIYMFK